jgi:transketolase
MNNKIIKRTADNIRILSAAMVEKASSGHPGGAMGAADFIALLYAEFLNFDPDHRTWPERDRFFLDPGHMSPMLYSILTLLGVYGMDDIKNFRQWGSTTPGHPELDAERGIENTSGPLGQGHAMAVGAAIAQKFLEHKFGKWMHHNIFTFVSDGGIQEEISQGAARLAGHLGLGNLIMFFDSNDIQLSTATAEVTSEDTEAKYESWGWRVRTVNGHDIDNMRAALKEAVDEKEKPTLIIGKTIMGKGCVRDDGSSFERQTSTHGQPISKAGASFEKTVRHLGGDPDDPFRIFPEVSEYVMDVLNRKRKMAARKHALKQEWEADHPGLADKYQSFLSGSIPDIDYQVILQKEHQATRAASGAVLGYFAQKVEQMIVASADLSNSDKTDGFLKHSSALTRKDFSGGFLQIGVSELTMAAVMNGLALHGGTIPVGGTFFVFSDFMKPAVRLAALMELPVKYVWTHDAFRVGEDGPTHQPVEQEAQIRLMEHLKNHSGKRSMLVLRPADSAETTVAWKMAMENTDTPTALILSRQGIKDLPARGASRFKDALQAQYGGYIVKDCEGTPDLIMVGSGSEVSTLYEGAVLLENKKKMKVRVVSVISEGLFRSQDPGYQASILPAGIPILGLTAGLPVTIQGLTGLHGKAIGLESFGYSAPAKVLDEKLGFTGEHVYKEALKFLDS